MALFLTRALGSIAACALCAALAGAEEVTLVERAADTAPSFTRHYRPVAAETRGQVRPTALPLDVTAIVNRGDLPYGDGERVEQALSRNGFVVVPQYMQEDMVSYYKDQGERDRAIYVTTDSLLNLFHVQFDTALRETEESRLAPLMARFSQAMLDRSLAQYNAFDAPVLKEAARRNLAYFGVGLALLEGDERSGPAHPAVREIVEQELALVAGHEGMTESPLFGYDEDYSQYVPRGHYTKSPRLEAYFRAMMWYGRMTMLLKGKEPGIDSALVSAEEARIQTVQALLIAGLLGEDSDAAARELRGPWQTVYAVTGFFVGAADDLTPAEYAAELRAVLGASFDWTRLGDEATYPAVRERLAALRSPAIFGGQGDLVLMPPFSPEQLDEVLDASKGMRLMGQRFVPDSHMFQRLVFPAVGRHTGPEQPFTLGETPGGAVRVFPRGLDVLAVLGSDRALEILRSEGDTAYEGYDDSVKELRAEFAALPDTEWRRSLYWCWLDTLRAMVEPAPEGYPSYMRSPAWQDRMLQGALASWATLRHDTILYAKQSYTPLAGAAPPGEDDGPPPVPLGYVEPIPTFYARLLATTRMLHTGLERLALLDEATAGRLTALDEVLDRCLRISERELAGQWLEEEDYAWILGIGRTLERTLDRTEDEAANPMLVADVHTDTNSGLVLEEGVGAIQHLAVVWSGPDGKPRCAVGPILTYYEFKQPMADRLTDEAWREMVHSETAPLPPAWTTGYLGVAAEDE